MIWCIEQNHLVLCVCVCVCVCVCASRHIEYVLSGEPWFKSQEERNPSSTISYDCSIIRQPKSYVTQSEHRGWSLHKAYDVYCVSSVISDSLQPHGPQPTRLLYPWNFPSKNPRVGCHFLLQRIFPTQGFHPHLLHLLHWQTDSLPLCHLGSP